MDYVKAVEIGRERAEQAAEAIRSWTAVEAMAVCAVKPGRSDRDWRPVGQMSRKEIAEDERPRTRGRYHLLIVDEDGTAKACTRKQYPLGEVLSLADRLPVPVAMPGSGELWKALAQETRILTPSPGSA